MSAKANTLRLIATNGQPTREGIKQELADYLANHSAPAITATIDHITGSRITITAHSPADVAHLVQATLTPASPANLV